MVPEDLFESLFGHKVSLFGLNVEFHLYGFFIAIGILFAVGIMYYYTSKKGMPSIMQDFCFFCGIIAIVFGFLFAKLFQAFYDYIETGKFDFAHAGITAMGGFIGGAIFLFLSYFIGGKIYFRGKNKNLHLKEFNKFLVVAPCSLTIAHAFGRVGCLMAGCCHGAYLGDKYVVGGIYMHVPDKGIWGYFVPTQLYESLFLFLLFISLSILFFKKSNITVPIYFIAYGIWRMIIEIFRDDYRGAIILGLSPSQWLSILFVVIGIAWMVIYKVLKIPFKNNYETVKKIKGKQSGK